MNTIEGSKFQDLVLELHDTMLENNIVLIYEGEINQEITKAFTNLTQRNLEESDETLQVQKRVYHVMVECMQNVTKHTDDFDSGEPINPGEGILVVAKTGPQYIVITGNSVAIDKVDKLKEHIDKVNSLDRDGVKKLYKEKILESRISEKGGAGLGFIDLVKKTGNKLEYRFQDINDKTKFFMLKTVVN